MFAWKQWWNRVQNREFPEDDVIETVLDFIGFFPIHIAILVIVIGGFSLYWYLRWRYLD